MNRNLLITCLLVVSLSGSALAGYRELKDELKAYRPPDYVLPGPGTKAEIVPPSPDDVAFDVQRQKLAALKRQWEEWLTSADKRDQFVAVRPDLATSLKKIAQDARAAAQLVRNRFTLEQIEAMTLVRNPGVKAAENGFRAEMESFTQVSQLDAVLKQYTAFTEGVMTGVGPMKGKDPVKMKFPFPGTLALKGEIAAKTVEAAGEELGIARRNAVTEARKAFWNLAYAHRARDITGEMVELLQHLDSVATTRYESGKTSYQDVIKVRIQWETLTEELVTLDERQRTVEAKLREVLNLSPEARIGFPQAPTPDRNLPKLEGLYALAGENRQEIKKIRALVGKMERMIDMAETMIQPAYTSNLSLYEDEAVNRVGSAAMKAPFDTVVPAGRGAGLPKLPWYGTEDAYLRQTRQKLAALGQKLQKTEAQTNFMVHNFWFELDRAHREEALYANTVVELSQTALDVATRSYESGKVAFADVSGAYTIWLKANLSLARKRSDMGIARAELARAVGKDI
jgi:outer membrane protein, heavy metal efflux system